MGHHLSTAPFDAIYSSDLQRAHQTALTIAANNQHCQEVKTSRQLREWNFGSLEGTTFSDFKRDYPQEALALKTNPLLFHSDWFQAEDVFQASQRIIDFVLGLQDSQTETVLIVSHGAILTIAIRRLLGVPMENIRDGGGLDNASISILQTADFQTFDQVIWNDTSYKHL